MATVDIKSSDKLLLMDSKHTEPQRLHTSINLKSSKSIQRHFGSDRTNYPLKPSRNQQSLSDHAQYTSSNSQKLLANDEQPSTNNPYTPPPNSPKLSTSNKQFLEDYPQHTLSPIFLSSADIESRFSLHSEKGFEIFTWLEGTRQQPLASIPTSDTPYRPTDFAIMVGSTSSSFRNQSARSETSLLMQYHNFRSTIFPPNLIYFRDATNSEDRVPEDIKSRYFDPLVQTVRQLINLSDIPPDIQQKQYTYRNKIAELVSYQEAFNSFIQVMDLKSTGWIDGTQRLSYQSRERFDPIVLPPAMGNSNELTLPNPRPDILYGYNPDFVPDLLPPDDLNTTYRKFRSTSSSEPLVYFPYLAIHAGNNLTGVENDCIISGRIMLDMTWPIFERSDAVFLLAVTPTQANLHIMWRESISDPPIQDSSEHAIDIDIVIRRQYKVDFVESFAIASLYAFLSLRSTLHQIHILAHERLEQIRPRIQQWKAAGGHMHEFTPVGRYHTASVPEEATES
ncbi:hypothetical protein F5Y00DRAFT_268518 [Daldinia vernicosa]|uniref:uncharacterized protein n=1 Tax=Daldinia vernicosa TaxID=114800 RepID=UPI0020075A7F|nr:uncharacterized protein F5Y00DRAFT_268518 [Daldinia vernicosa]KAI0850397.1 hypothetical protein F5Y00DRAFT_268518 [Daldinia vernicosa]